VRSAVFAVILLTVACSQADKVEHVEAKRTYSLCPRAENARQDLYERLKDFADRHHATVIDRSIGVKRELIAIESSILKNTNGDPILLTVERPGEYRISVTNLGLREKLALSVRMSVVDQKSSSLAGFVESLTDSWDVKEVSGSVADDPPC
jgi:hypothetical protein